MDLQAKIKSIIVTDLMWELNGVDVTGTAEKVFNLCCYQIEDTISHYTQEIQLLMQQIEDLEIDLMLQSEAFIDKAEPIQPKRRTRF